MCMGMRALLILGWVIFRREGEKRGEVQDKGMK